MTRKSLSPTLHFSAFTLVELIVVIAVLAVLAAISFSTVANISSGARDSARLTDISSMKTSLETYNATKGGYPLPDNATAITWSGNLAWSQGTFGDNTSRALNTISRPKDPKWNVDYSYSVSNSKKEYEIATVLEKATSYFPTDKVYAQGEQYDTVIKGSYNGVALRVSSAISTWILSVPTIIASDIKDAKLENIVFAYPKSGNEPFSYTGVVNSPQAVPTGWTVKQVWSGALVLPKSDSELQWLTSDLKTAYAGSPAASSEVIKSLLATTDNKGYGSNVVNNLGGNIAVVSGGNGCSKICSATAWVVSAFASGGGIQAPFGVAIDSAGNLYVANAGLHTISKINPAGVVSIFASGGGLSTPYGITIDSTGNLYVANYNGNNILKITSAGVVSVFASGGGISNPEGITIDNTGNLYVGNGGINTISKITSAGVVSVFASGGGISNPMGLGIDKLWNIYVANSGNNTVSKISPTGIVSTFATGGLSVPQGIVIDNAGNLYVTNYNSNTILKINSMWISDTFISAGSLVIPAGIVLDNLWNLYVANYGNGAGGNTISKITPQ